MDGLLLDTERLSEDSFRRARSLFDLDFDTELFAALTGLSGPAHRKILSTHLPDEVDVVALLKKCCIVLVLFDYSTVQYLYSCRAGRT